MRNRLSLKLNRSSSITNATSSLKQSQSANLKQSSAPLPMAVLKTSVNQVESELRSPRLSTKGAVVKKLKMLGN